MLWRHVWTLLCPVSKDHGHIVFWPVCLSVCKNFNIGHIFWMASDMAFISYMCVLYDKTFLLVPNFLTLWPWSLTYFLTTLTLAISFEWLEMGLSYFICVLYDKTFLLVPNILTLWHWSLTHFSKTLTLASDRAFIFHMCVPYDKTFLMVP
jgi:hypothetical protein